MSKDTTSRAVVDATEQKPASPPKPSKITKKWLLLLVTAILLVGITIISIILYHRNTVQNSNAFQIDNKYYSKKLVSDMANFSLSKTKKPTIASKTVAAKSIFELYKTEVAAQKAGIIPNSQELQTASKQITLPSARTTAETDYLNAVVFNKALNQTYSRYANGDDQGYTFVFDFSQKVLPPPAQEKPVAGQGNQTLINQDKQYAYQQAQKYFTEFKDHKISAQALLTTITADPRISFVNVSTYLDSSKGGIQSQIFYPDIYNYIAAQTKPVTSSIRVGKVETKLNPGPNDYADGYYYFVQLTKASPIVNNPAGKVGDQQNKLKAVYYGI